jgi:hypothetical protein
MRLATDGRQPSNQRAEPSALREMATRVQEYVREGPAHLARRAQAAVVVAAVEHRPAAAAHPVHGAREPGTDAHHAARECFLAVRFDDQVRMVSLQRVVRDAEVPTLFRLRQRAPPLMDQAAAPQRGHARAHAQRDVNGALNRNRASLPVEHARPRAARSA